MTACVGSGCSGSGSGGSARFCSNIRSDMFLGIWISNLTDWGGWRSRIGVVILEECIGVLDCVIRGIQNICVRCCDHIWLTLLRTVKESAEYGAWITYGTQRVK